MTHKTKSWNEIQEDFDRMQRMSCVPVDIKKVPENYVFDEDQPVKWNLGKSDDQLSQADAIRKWNTRPALPVIHAKWEWHGPCRDNKGTYWATCTDCGIRQRLGDYENYCPKCGARMDLEGDEQ